MKAFIVVIGLASLAGRIQAQQRSMSSDINNPATPKFFNVLPASDTVKFKNSLAAVEMNFASPGDEHFYSNMPVVKFEGKDNMPVYYSATNDRMPIKYLNSASNNSVKDNFFAPVQIPKVSILTLPEIKIK